MNRDELMKRVTDFGESIIDLCRTVEKNDINKPLIGQLIRSGTSIGANYCEAVNASSRKDFSNKIFICKKESQETQYWLQMIAKCNKNEKKLLRELWKECHELTMIFQKTVNSLRSRNDQ